MKILFIYSGAESLGIEYLSSFLESKGHPSELLFDPAVFSGDLLLNNKFLSRIFSLDNQIIQKAISSSPGLIAFSSYTGNYQWCLKIAEEIKKRSQIPIVFGGIHPTAAPQEVLKNYFVDYVIIGEGEYALLELAEQIADGKGEFSKISNLGYKSAKGGIYINEPRGYIKDLDSLPFPKKSLFYGKVPLLSENYMITTSRGCPFNCNYCSNSMLHELYRQENRHVRRRSPKNVIDELKWAKSNWNIRLVVFADDVFTCSRAWLEEFIPIYKSEINLPFFCSVHPNAMSGEIAALLKEGGCWLVTMGVQSGSERIRKEIFGREGNNSRILESIKHVKEAGMKISLDNIFGAPTENENDLQSGLELYEEARPDRILTFWLTYYPNTKIIDIAKDNHCLTETDISNINNGITGFTHGGGSVVDGKMKKTYLVHELRFQLRALINNDWLHKFILKMCLYFPSDFLVKIIVLLNAIKNRDVKMFYLMRYIWARKTVP